MGKQSNILSFDEAKREIGAKRPSTVMPSGAARRRPARNGSGAYAPTAPPRTSSQGRHAATPPYGATSSRRANTLTQDSPHAAVTAFSTRDDRVSREKRGAYRSRTASSTRGGVAEEFEADQVEEASEKRSRFAEFRRKRQKGRADKKFTKQFGDAKPASDASSGPRAAVYKGEMGATHRRSSRMQNDTSTASRSATSPGLLSRMLSWKSSPKFAASGVVVICLALTCWFLYTPAQQFYQSSRDHARLQAEYAAIEQRNASLQSEVDTLGTEAGVEDRARQQFGWVKSGEQTGTVKGLSEQHVEDSNFTANIVPGSIPAPETWYSPLLDVVFGVS